MKKPGDFNLLAARGKPSANNGFTPTPEQRKLPCLVCTGEFKGDSNRKINNDVLNGKRGNNNQSFVRCRGFTLVELLVAIGLFSVIVSTAMGGFVRALRTQKQLVALISANSNASLVIEQISREIRTGFNFSGPADASALVFINAKGEDVTYTYNPAGGLKPYGYITRNAEQITADSVNIRYLRFSILNNAPNYPARVTIAAGVSPTKEASVGESITKIQTTISARTF